MRESGTSRIDAAMLREALRVIPELLETGAYLAAAGPEAAARQTGDYGLYSPRNGLGRPLRRVEKKAVSVFQSLGLIEADAGRYVITDAGCAWLRRQDAGAEPFREQHQIKDIRLVDAGGGVRRPAVVNDAESPLGWLRRRKGKDGAPLIDAAQFEAGERLRADFTRGHMTPSVTANWGAPAPSKRKRRAAPEGPAALADDALAARKRVACALEWVGPELSGILLDICCHLHGLEDAENAHGWPKRSGKVILQIALTRLARHYGLAHAGSSGKRGQGLRHWGSADYKPSLDQWS